MSRYLEKWFLSERPPNCHVADLETSFDPKITLRKLQRYKMSVADWCHYGFLGSVLLFVFITNPAPWFLKFLAYAFLGLLFIIPITSQFFFNALPILTWVALYFTSSSFPASSRPPITVKVLPAIETILYGDNLSDILATSTNPILDILAWIPYGVLHFSAPFFIAAVLFVFGPPTILQGFSFAFGYMNLFGVIIQNFFPAAPPWYKILYGLQSAHYGMHGSPGGLARIDKLLNINVYTQAFSNSSVIFGAFPSLHSGCSTIDALFLAYCFPRLTPLFIGYVCWLWWSTMYLTHHYFVDLIAGSVISYVVFQYTKYFHLPVVDVDLFCRWSYSSIEKYDMVRSDPLQVDSNDVESVPLQAMDLGIELNRRDTREGTNSLSPYIFDRNDNSSATSNTSLDLQGDLLNPTSRLGKQRVD
ncbi:hypothetical protein KAFR_0D03310 [Kazachstania africana CBS 2517]|uniref:Phosphatidic acid phosphatase type 2/haloperoxidase domain-containing protein n=1 Tax=Kazachstania africana (strain ATCC 22294 / BCRC 22015 / CBS 2517 / CECT 1963 / NBRC 1671 / NRRL Y-8276) TaxID=1071382 RepID=H2AUC9_KAZAF|nr:hypothetical protein KAFR_0D03310 [Kazachstania africana CBS 2517]CCF57979.1 hypothetical protein KAFR_0D03310 [Kazachstania africana CBS 2517]